MAIFIVVYAGFVVFGVAMVLIYVPFPEEARQFVEVARNISLIAAGVITLPALLYALWIREASYEMDRKALPRSPGEGDIGVQN
ncbi:MAG: hypothetical protein OXK73_03025 [Rhodospirillaceae bacterium]|nr:hypothetical protein [Rhodospirillaceae bacterium]